MIVVSTGPGMQMPAINRALPVAIGCFRLAVANMHARNHKRFVVFQLFPWAAWIILSPRNQLRSSELNDGF